MKRTVMVELTVDTEAKRKSDIDALLKLALKGATVGQIEHGTLKVLSVRPQPDYRKIPLR